MTPERQALFDNAYKNLRDSLKLRNLADAFQNQGFDREASLLRKRANLRDLPKEVGEARRAIFKKGMVSSNLQAVQTLAKVYEQEGALGAAEKLRERAEVLRNNLAEPKKIPQINTEVPSSPEPEPEPEPEEDSEAAPTST
jgi:hypothetical protein